MYDIDSLQEQHYDANLAAYTEWRLMDEDPIDAYPVAVEPICGMCSHYCPSRVIPGQGYCPVAYHINEWDEPEIGSPRNTSDPICPKYDEDCPF
jgi:hypothetical protein